MISFEGSSLFSFGRKELPNARKSIEGLVLQCCRERYSVILQASMDGGMVSENIIIIATIENTGASHAIAKEMSSQWTPTSDKSPE